MDWMLVSFRAVPPETLVPGLKMHLVVERIRHVRLVELLRLGRGLRHDAAGWSQLYRRGSLDQRRDLV